MWPLPSLESTSARILIPCKDSHGMTRHIDCARCDRGVHKPAESYFRLGTPHLRCRWCVRVFCMILQCMFVCNNTERAGFRSRWILAHCNCIISADDSRTERYASRLRRRLVEVTQPRQILDNHFGQGWVAHCLISIAGKRSDGVSASYRFQSQKAGGQRRKIV